MGEQDRTVLSAAGDRLPGGLPDVVASGTRLLLAGINPGRASARRGCHYAGAGNRFWPALAAAGLTPRRLTPAEQHELPRFGLGLTVLVQRPTTRAEDLTAQELRDGGQRLAAVAAELDVAAVAVLGIGAYRAAFDAPQAVTGPRTDPRSDQGRPRWWLLPNPSGLNARWRVTDHAELLTAVARDAGLLPCPSAGPAATNHGWLHE